MGHEEDYFWRVLALIALVTGVWMAALALTGCSTGQVSTAAAIPITGKVVDRPGLSRAVSQVWDCYGRKDAPPRVRVVEGVDLSCTDPVSGRPGFPVLLPNETLTRFVEACREGFTYLPDEVMVAYRGQPWHETPLAHELQHAKQTRENVIDPNHKRPEWQPGGEVDRCNGAMMVAEQAVLAGAK